MAGFAVWRGGSVTQLTWPRRTARVTWTEKKTERICRSCTRLPVHDGRGSSWALQQDEAALRAPAGRYTQGGRAGGQSLRRDDVGGSRTDDEFWQGHLRKTTSATFVRWRLSSSCWIELCGRWARKPRTPVGIWLNTSRPR